MINACRERIKMARVVVRFKNGNNSSELVHSVQYKAYALSITWAKRDSWMLPIHRQKTGTIPLVKLSMFLLLLDDGVRYSCQNIRYH
jgi:hypothetical protein